MLDRGRRSGEVLHRLPGESDDAMRDRISALHRRIEFTVFGWIELKGHRLPLARVREASRSKPHQEGCRLSPPDHPGDHRQALAA
jgi:hypothetical protein